MLWKYFCIKDFHVYIRDVHKKTLQAGKCKKVSIKAGEATTSKGKGITLYDIFGKRKLL